MEGAWIAPDAKRPRRRFPGAVAIPTSDLVVAVVVTAIVVPSASATVSIVAPAVLVIISPLTTVLIIALVVVVTVIVIIAPATIVVTTIVVGAVVVPTVVVGTVVTDVLRADDRHVAVLVASRALNDDVAVLVARLTLVDRPAVSVVADLIPAATVHLVVGAAVGAVINAVYRAGAAATHNYVGDAAGSLRVRAGLTAPSLVAGGSLCAEGREGRESRERYANDQKLHKNILGVNGLPVILVVLHLLLLLLLTFLQILFLLLLSPFPLLVICARAARAENRERPIAVTTRTLDHDVAARINSAALVDRVVVPALAYLVPRSIIAAVYILTRIRIRAAEDDVTDTVGCLVVGATIVAIVGVAVTHRLGAVDAQIAVHTTARALHDDVAVTVLYATLVDRPGSIATDHGPRSVPDCDLIRAGNAAAYGLRVQGRCRGEARERQCDG